jgi:SAM-dependent methyltransferase
MDSIPDKELKYVVEAYNKISSSFDRTRHTPWKSVIEFIKSLSKENVLFEAGCGNGKNLMLHSKENSFGIDVSESLVNICRKKGLYVDVADICNIPIRDNTFDASISIAVIHHLSTEERRIKSIEEIVRVTKPYGKILIEVWAHEKNFPEKEQDRSVLWKNVDGTICCDRYYHFFKKDEIESICIKGGIKIEYIKEEMGNWMIYGKK